jgi:hypothetical protein
MLMEEKSYSNNTGVNNPSLLSQCLNLQRKTLTLPIYITTRFWKKLSVTFFHFLQLPQMLSTHPCHDFQVMANRFSSPLAVIVGKLPYRLELCFLPRQIGPWPSDTRSTASHSFYHVQWSEHVIPYQVTCLLEQRDVSKKKASYTQGSDRASYCHASFQLAHIRANVCCVPNTIDVVIGEM